MGRVSALFVVDKGGPVSAFEATGVHSRSLVRPGADELLNP